MTRRTATEVEFDAQEQVVVDERQPDYGDPYECHLAIAHVWSGIVNQVLSRDSSKAVSFGAYEVALMLAAMKIVRLAHAYKPDSALDAKVYLKFAEEFARRRV